MLVDQFVSKEPINKGGLAIKSTELLIKKAVCIFCVFQILQNIMKNSLNII